MTLIRNVTSNKNKASRPKMEKNNNAYISNASLYSGETSDYSGISKSLITRSVIKFEV